ncbi:MarR family transcriptional regulator [Paenibacillus faecis]|uniref:LexA family protein n=1 Tax=Paenibacillus faecis TaxID=862114 RepID=UPI001BCAFB5D|nr:MarR family transcriptional regulator [Paenibacillus faecis]
MTNKPLTRRQAEALEFIKAFLAKNGYPPTVREIAEHMGYHSSSTAFQLLEQLVRKGFVTKGAGPRMLRVVSGKEVSVG